MAIAETEPTGPPPRRRLLPRRWGLWLVGGVAVVLAGVGVYVWQQYRELTSAEYTRVAYTVPRAPQLPAAAGATTYRIDPTRSAVSYSVDEKLFGQSTSQAKGTTNGIAGDLAINESDPAASQVGQIVVNVEQLHSDNSLRDARIRSDYLESHDNPLVYLTVSDLAGLPDSIQEGQAYHFTMSGQLVVKKTPGPVTWHVDASVADGKLSATATTKVKMSSFAIGPISIAGLVSTGDEITLKMHLVAVDPTKFQVPDQIAAPTEESGRGGGPSFENVVMPALRADCASCHNAGEVGAAHWRLDTAGDAAAVADGLGTVVDAGYMPPWPASDVGVPLAHSKRLSTKDRAAIVAWAEAGGNLDVDQSTRITPTEGPTGTPPRRDVVMKMPEAYAGSLAVANDYRCFVLDPKITVPTFVTGYAVTPGQRQEIHHAQIFHIDASQVEASKARAGKDGKPGWSCYTGPTLPSTTRVGSGIPGVGAPKPGARPDLRSLLGQPGLIAGWVPGQDPVVYPEQSGILFQPGDAIVLQMHYHYSSEPTPDRSTVALQTDPGTDPIRHLDIVNPIGPVEIPCAPGATAPLCDRSAALVDAARQYGPAGSLIEQGLLLMCRKQASDLAATFHNGVASSSCDSKVPESGTMVGAMGHMHTLGKTFRLTLDPEKPTPTVLLDIPTWNFDWQMNYEFQTPIHVTAGQTIRMECSWDRSLDPTRPEKYIVFAEGTEDEMCFSTYAIIPDTQG